MKRSAIWAVAAGIVFSMLTIVDLYVGDVGGDESGKNTLLIRAAEILVGAVLVALTQVGAWSSFVWFQAVPLATRLFIQSPFSSPANNMWPIGMGIEIVFSGIVFVFMLAALCLVKRSFPRA